MVAKQVEAKALPPQQAGAAAQQPGAPRYEATLLQVALDCLSGLVEGLGASVEPLVSASPLMALLLQCCADDVPGVSGSERRGWVARRGHALAGAEVAAAQGGGLPGLRCARCRLRTPALVTQRCPPMAVPVLKFCAQSNPSPGGPYTGGKPAQWLGHHVPGPASLHVPSPPASRRWPPSGAAW